MILAAGASRRLGSCKAIARLGGSTPLQRLVEAGEILDDHPPLVVTGADHDAILPQLPAGCEVAHNPAWESGRTGGIALAATRRPGRDLCLAPVDVPLVPAGVFEALAAHWAEAGNPERGWLTPRCDGRGGHPVILGRALAAELESFSADRPLRELRERASPCLSLEVGAPEILDDLDTREDLAELRKRIEAE